MKKSILLLFVAVMALGAIARSVTSEMAIAAANAWAARNAAFGAGARAAGGVLTERDPANANIVLWHQVSMQGGGMLVVAPVTEIEPVVMALDNDPGRLAKAHPLRALLTGDMRRRLQFLGRYSAGGATLQSVVPGAPAVEISEDAKAWGDVCNAKWARFTGASLQESAEVGVKDDDLAMKICVARGFEKGGALTHWNQGSDASGKYLYNSYTPGHAVCGCVATACSALAQFYGTTNAVLLSNKCSYNGEVAIYKTIPGAIDWSILPENWGGTNAPAKTLSNEQQELIGRVAYNAGVGHGMGWTDDESGAYTSEMADVLKNVFGFKNARSVSLGEDASQYEKIIYNQCRAGAVVAMGIDGHAVVACGYGLDKDGVERVRVFMGWAGAGDGWYALPKIDTKATMKGGTYLSEVVHCAITMVSYADDDVVPIVGRVSMPGAKLEIADLDRVFESDDYGYFGTRVPAELGTVEVTCQGKSAQIDIGEAAKASESADELCAEDGLPGAFEFVLLNASVAYSLERAKIMALKEGKAILRVSGTSGSTNTAAVLDHIYELDDGNVDGFSDRFVYYYTGSNSEAGDGADVSFGVYLPQDVDAGRRWEWNNGALAYGYSSTRSMQTNVTHDVSHAAETNGLDQVVTTRTFTSTFAPADADPVVSTNDVEDVDAILTAILESLDAVINVGGTRYAECTSGIAVTIAATSEEAEAAINVVATPQDKCGLHERIYAPGSHTFVCDAVVTNEAAGLVMGCAGWSITNATTGAVLSGAGSEAMLDLASNDVITLTWDFSKTNAIYITVKFTGEVEALDPEAVTPGSGWYPYGVPVQFQAKGKVGNYGFDYFKDANIPDGTVWLSEASVLVPVVQSGTVEARYVKGAKGPEDPEPVTETCAVTVKNYVWDVATKTVSPADDQVPDTCVYSSEEPVEIADGETVDVPATMVYFAPSAIQYTTADGVKMEYYGVLVGDEIYVGEPLPVESDLEDASAATVMWVWKSVKEGDDPEEPPTEFKIEWDDALTVLNAQGYSTNLLTKAQFEKLGITIDEVKVTAPKGFVAKLAFGADGGVVATLELDEEVLQPVGLDGASSPLTILSNGDGTVTVKADVANGVRGFWYSLYATDELGGTWTVVTTGYQAGNPSVQATADDVTVSLSIDVEPTDAKKFYKLVVTDVKP